MSVFANAYQNMLASQGRGGGLTGQAAIAALLEAVPTGTVRSAELLPFVSQEMQIRAAPKLEIAKNTSQGWQGVLANQRTDWTRIASESGVEEGQRNFFRFFSQWMNQNQDIPERFGKWWEEFSKQFAIAGGFGDLIKMTLEGQETIIKEWLGAERTEQLRKDFDLLAEKARAAAGFLGLLDEKQEGRGLWREIVDRGAAAVGTVGALMDGDFSRAGTEAGILFEGAGDAYLRRMPHLRAAGALKDKLYGIVSPERDDAGFAIPYLKMTGQQPTYHPRGAELLMMGQQPAQSSTPPLVIENITLNANSGDKEELTQLMTNVLKDSYERAMQGLNR